MKAKLFYILILMLTGIAACSSSIKENDITIGSISAAVGFDWGSSCESGSGEFEQYISFRQKIIVGEIPIDKKDVIINLKSLSDVDIQLIDKESGHQIIAWPNGDLNGATVASTEYFDIGYEYSGYNGVNGNLGHEYIKIFGVTNRILIMKAFGYAADNATVTYSWSAVNTCNEVGNGTFQQRIPRNNTIEVGVIPVNKVNVAIELKAQSGKDIDIQLINKNTGEEVVAWPNGLMSGATQQEIDYLGMKIKYSGYNGIAGNWGHEKIEIFGRTTVELIMKAFGYQAGFATVSYEWGIGAGLACGSRGLPACLDGLFCKEGDNGNTAVDVPGQCHNELWCESNASAAKDCVNVIHPMTPGQWACEEFTCKWVNFIPTQCGDPKDGYKKITPSEAADNAGEKVQITWPVSHAKFAACTKMGCSESNPCCNHCSARFYFDELQAVSSTNGMDFGCYGNECNWEESCTYPDSEVITVYGTISEDGLTVVVDDHCEGGMFEQPVNMCEDLAGVDFGMCEMFMGYGVVNGNCQGMSGCGALGHEFFPSKKECELECVVPEIKITLKPSVTGGYKYMPFEVINACIENISDVSIFLPGCSVFNLKNINTGEIKLEIICVWEGVAKEVFPGESYCNDQTGGLFANKVGEYEVMTSMGTDCDATQPLNQQNCGNVLQVYSEDFNVECPSFVNCMPIVAPAKQLICGLYQDDFQTICPDTQFAY